MPPSPPESRSKSALKLGVIAAGALLMFVLVALLSTSMRDWIAREMASFGKQPTYISPNPIRFSHQLHEGMTCVTCHIESKADKHMVSVETCNSCHRKDTAIDSSALLP